MHSLPLFVRLAGRAVILIGDGDAADAKRRLLERAGATVTDDPAAAALLAVVALDDAAEAAMIAEVLKRRGILVNVVDQPALCDVTFPSILERDPVLIAIGSGGASAGLVKALRLRLETLLPTGLGPLARGLQAARARMREQWPDAATRRRAIDAALAAGGMLDPLRDDAADGLERWLDDGGAAMPAHRHHRIVLASDDPDDLTLRDARLLGTADVVRHAADVPSTILARARADARLLPMDDSIDDLASGLTVTIAR